MAAHVIRARRQAGFSLIEVVITGAIMTIGLLGLMLLQTMAIRTNLSGQNVSTSVRIASKVLDSVAAEGRMRKAQAQYGNALAGWAGAYYTANATLTEKYDKDGNATTVDADAIYTAVVTRVVNANLPAAFTGMGVDQYQVVVTYKEVPDPKSGAAVTRSLTMNRVVGI